MPWMYSKAKPDIEEYLMGKRVDKAFYYYYYYSYYYYYYYYCVYCRKEKDMPWMYSKAKPDTEEYLMGKRVDKAFETQDEPPPTTGM